MSWTNPPKASLPTNVHVLKHLWNSQLFKNLPKERKQERREKHKKGGRDTASQESQNIIDRKRGKKEKKIDNGWEKIKSWEYMKWESAAND